LHKSQAAGKNIRRVQLIIKKISRAFGNLQQQETILKKIQNPGRSS